MSGRILFRVRPRDSAPIEPLASHLMDNFPAVVTLCSSGGQRRYIPDKDGTFEVRLLEPRLEEELRQLIEKFDFETVALVEIA